MTEKRPIEWEDMRPEFRELAIRTVAARGRLPLEEAEDVVFDAMLKIMNTQPEVSNLRAYLVRASINELTSRKRRAGRRPNFVRFAEESGGEYPSAVHEVAGEEAATPVALLAEEETRALNSKRIQDAMSRLSEADRAILHAYYFEDRSLSDMDRDSGERPGTAQGRVFRARRRLRLLMGPASESESRSR